MGAGTWVLKRPWLKRWVISELRMRMGGGAERLAAWDRERSVVMKEPRQVQVVKVDKEAQCLQVSDGVDVITVRAVEGCLPELRSDPAATDHAALNKKSLLWHILHIDDFDLALDLTTPSARIEIVPRKWETFGKSGVSGVGMRPISSCPAVQALLDNIFVYTLVGRRPVEKLPATQLLQLYSTRNHPAPDNNRARANGQQSLETPVELYMQSDEGSSQYNELDNEPPLTVVDEPDQSSLEMMKSGRGPTQQGASVSRGKPRSLEEIADEPSASGQVHNTTNRQTAAKISKERPIVSDMQVSVPGPAQTKEKRSGDARRQDDTRIESERRASLQTENSHVRKQTTGKLSSSAEQNEFLVAEVPRKAPSPSIGRTSERSSERTTSVEYPARLSLLLEPDAPSARDEGDEKPVQTRRLQSRKITRAARESEPRRASLRTIPLRVNNNELPNAIHSDPVSTSDRTPSTNSTSSDEEKDSNSKRSWENLSHDRNLETGLPVALDTTENKKQLRASLDELKIDKTEPQQSGEKLSRKVVSNISKRKHSQTSAPGVDLSLEKLEKNRGTMSEDKYLAIVRSGPDSTRSKQASEQSNLEHLRRVAAGVEPSLKEPDQLTRETVAEEIVEESSKDTIRAKMSKSDGDSLFNNISPNTDSQRIRCLSDASRPSGGQSAILKNETAAEEPPGPDRHGVAHTQFFTQPFQETDVPDGEGIQEVQSRSSSSRVYGGVPEPGGRLRLVAPVVSDEEKDTGPVDFPQKSGRVHAQIIEREGFNNCLEESLTLRKITSHQPPSAGCSSKSLRNDASRQERGSLERERPSKRQRAQPMREHSITKPQNDQTTAIPGDELKLCSSSTDTQKQSRSDASSEVLLVRSAPRRNPSKQAVRGLRRKSHPILGTNIDATRILTGWAARRAKAVQSKSETRRRLSLFKEDRQQCQVQ